MTIDVTQNAQYQAVKQTYDNEISKDLEVENLWKDFTDKSHQMGYLDSSTPEWQALKKQTDDDMNKMAQQLDCDAAIRQQIVNGQDPAAILKQQETDALAALQGVLVGQDQVNNANNTALNTPSTSASAKSGPVHGTEDIMTRAMGVFAMLSDATDGVSNNYMDIITDNVDHITDLNGSSQTVRGLRPTGKATDTCTINKADMDKISANGVTLPTDMKTDSNGNYTVTQADCDTLLNNIQSQSSSLTTLNQNTTISLNKSIDVGQQCSQFQTSELEKWSQLMSKILS